MNTRSDFTFEEINANPEQLLLMSANVSFNGKQNHELYSNGEITEKGIKCIEKLIKNFHKSPFFLPKIIVSSAEPLKLINFTKEELAGIDWASDGNLWYNYTFSLYSALKLYNDKRLPFFFQQKVSGYLRSNFPNILKIWQKYESEKPKLSEEEKTLYQKYTLEYYNFKIEIPFFLANEIKRHILGFNFTEVSRRYSNEGIQYYVPQEYYETGLLPKKADSKRQGRVENEFVKECKVKSNKLKFYDEETGTVDMKYQVTFDYNLITFLQNDWYEENSEIIAPEVCRNILPQCTYTTIIASMSVSCAARICSLRIDYHAQLEAQVFAKQIREYFITVCPEFDDLIEIAKKI